MGVAGSGDPPPDDRDRGSAVAAVGVAVAAPYGYTITVWGAGALLVHFRGTPDVADVFLFAGGGLAGFSVFGAAAGFLLARRGTLENAHARLGAGIFAWLAGGGALGAAALLAQLRSRFAWTAVAFTGTVVYLVLVSLQLGLADRALGIGQQHGGIDQ